METLTTTLQDMITPSLLGRLAVDSGLPESKVRTGITGAVASIFDGLADQADDTRAMNRVADLISTGPDVDVLPAEQLVDTRSPLRDTGQELVAIAAPDRRGLVSRLSSMLGVGATAASALVASAGGLVFAAFRKLGRQRGGFDGRDVATLLHDEGPAIHAAVPAALIVPSRTDVRGAYVREPGYVHEREVVTREPSRSLGWLWLLLLIPLAIIAYWLFARPRTERVTTSDVPEFRPFAAVEREVELERSTMPDRAVAPDTTAVPPATPETATPGTATPGTQQMTPGADQGMAQPQATQPEGTTQPQATQPEGTTQPQATQPEGMTQPQATQPEGTTQPQATQPEGMTNPPTTQPQTAAPEGMTQPPTTQPQATQPEGMAQPQATQPEGMAQPQATQPEGTTQPQATQPEGTTQPQATKPEGMTQPPTTQPQTAPPDETAPPETAQPQMARPDDTEQPEMAQPDTTQPGAAQPGAAQPDTTQPGAAQPDTTQPGAAQPDTTQPGAAEPSAGLSFPAGTAEAKLLDHVRGPAGNDHSTWIELDQVTFASGKATLEPSASEQIENVAKILEANPDMTFRIGGYTDATGSKAANLKLSEARAAAVKKALVEQGVDAKQLTTKGYGSAQLVEETRGDSQANRRAAIRVMTR